MKYRPILFGGPMVKATQEGRKTQTRRVIKPQFNHKWGSGVRNGDDRYSVHVDIPNSDGTWKWLYCPYGQVGDRLWVKETFFPLSVDPVNVPLGIKYRADNDFDPHKECYGCSWRPSIHMPRWASRITLENTNIRVERLNSISEQDAIAEGAEPNNEIMPSAGCPHIVGFSYLWDSINGKKYPWESNPLVWVVEFKVVT